MENTETTKNLIITVVDMDKLRRVKKPENYKQFATLAKSTTYGYNNVYKHNAEFIQFLNRKNIYHRVEKRECRGSEPLYTILEYK